MKALRNGIKEQWSGFKELLIVLIIMVTVRSSLANWYLVPSGSMMPTIKIGDHVFCNKLAYGLMLPFMEKQVISWAQPARGDIVPFRYPKGTDTYIKRVVGVSGDVITFHQGVLTVNGKTLKEEEVRDRHVLDDMGESAADKTLYREYGPGDKPHYVLRYTLEQALDRMVMRRSIGGHPSSTNPAYYTTQGDTEIRRVPPDHILVVGDNRDSSNDGRFWGFVEAKRVYCKASHILYSTVSDKNSWVPSFRWDRTFATLE